MSLCGKGQAPASADKSGANDQPVARESIRDTSQSSIPTQGLHHHSDEATWRMPIPEEPLPSEERVPTGEDAEQEVGESLLTPLSLQGQQSVYDVDRLSLAKTSPAPSPLPQPPAAVADKHPSSTMKRCPHPDVTHSTTVLDSLRLPVAVSASNDATTSVTLYSSAAEEPDPDPPSKHSCATDYSSVSETYLDHTIDTPQLPSNVPLDWICADVERLSGTDPTTPEDIHLRSVVRPFFIELSPETEKDHATTDKSKPLLRICGADSPTQTEEDEQQEGEEKCYREGEKGEESDTRCLAEPIIRTSQRIRSDVSTTRAGFAALNRRITDNCLERLEESRELADDEERHARHKRTRFLLRLLRCRIHNRTGAVTKHGQLQVQSGSFLRVPDGGHFACGKGNSTGVFENPSATYPHSLALASQPSAVDGVRFASGLMRSSHVQDTYLLPEHNVASYNSELTIRQRICQPATEIPRLLKRNDDQDEKACRQVTRSSQRSVKMIVVIFVAFLLTYLPFTIMNLADEQSVLDRRWYMITSLGFWSGSCVNPLIYGIMNRQFRAAYGSIFLSCRKTISRRMLDM